MALLDALQEVPQLLLRPDQRLLRLEAVSGGTNSMFFDSDLGFKTTWDFITHLHFSFVKRILQS